MESSTVSNRSLVRHFGYSVGDFNNSRICNGLGWEEKEMRLYRMLVTNPRVPGQPFGVGTTEIVVVLIILIISIIVRKLVRLKR